MIINISAQYMLNDICEEYYKYIINLFKAVRDDAIKNKENNGMKIADINGVFTRMQSNKNKKQIEASCKKIYKNEGCVGTEFEKGDDRMIVEKMVKNDKNLNKVMKKMTTEKKKEWIDKIIDEQLKLRKSLYNGKSDILVDNFYNKIKGVKTLRAYGATSGCTYPNKKLIKYLKSRSKNSRKTIKNKSKKKTQRI